MACGGTDIPTICPEGAADHTGTRRSPETGPGTALSTENCEDWDGTSSGSGISTYYRILARHVTGLLWRSTRRGGGPHTLTYQREPRFRRTRGSKRYPSASL